MKKELSRLVLYHELGRDPILHTLADVAEAAEHMGTPGNPDDLPFPDLTDPANDLPFDVHFPGKCRKRPHPPVPPKEMLVDRVYDAIRRLLEIATSYGFDRNLWQDYLTFLLLTNENPFSLTAEKKGIGDGSVRHFAHQDMEIFCRLFVYDFSKLEEKLGIDCFSVVTNYVSVPKRAQNFNRNVSLRVRKTSDAILEVLKKHDIDKMAEEGMSADPGNKEIASEISKAADDMLEIISDFYLKYGVGMFGLNRAFRLAEAEPEGRHRGPAHGSIVPPIRQGLPNIAFQPINNTEEVHLSDLVGYEIQKQKLRENTEAFLKGHRANNVLLYGDAGTGKSTSIKALITEYYDQGLRMIELYKHEMQKLSAVIGTIKHRNYKFIIYMDDLSFEDFEVEYKYLKAVIEGGLESRPDNVLIYATSNRRHLVKETWNDTSDVDLEKHRGDTLQEKLSLVDRFGITIPYMKPNKKEFMEIVRNLAARHPEITLSEDELLMEAQKWEMAHGGFSGRIAQQFINYIAGLSS